MNRQRLINELKQGFMLKRIRAQEKAENNIKKLCENLFLFILIYYKMYVILADIGNDNKQMWFCHQLYESS